MYNTEQRVVSMFFEDTALNIASRYRNSIVKTIALRCRFSRYCLTGDSVAKKMYGCRRIIKVKALIDLYAHQKQIIL